MVIQSRLISVVKDINFISYTRIRTHWNEVEMSCTCGRSPTGKCVGWHKLSEAEYAEKKAEWEAKQSQKADLNQ